MSYHVYAIKNEQSGKIYIGHTSDLDKRFQRHNGLLPNKVSSFTSKNKGVWVVVYSEEHSDRISARAREKELKSFCGREFIRDKINKTARSSVGRAAAS